MRQSRTKGATSSRLRLLVNSLEGIEICKLGVTSANLRVGDSLVYATADGKAKHFANFIFRTDAGVAKVYSKSGAGNTGAYMVTTAGSLEGEPAPGVVYGNVNGYYREVRRP